MTLSETVQLKETLKRRTSGWVIYTLSGRGGNDSRNKIREGRGRRNRFVAREDIPEGTQLRKRKGRWIRGRPNVLKKKS